MTTALTLPAPAPAPASSLLGSVPADQSAGADLFAAVFTAVAEDEPQQAAPSPELPAAPAQQSDVAPQPLRDDATADEATAETPAGTAADELTRSRALLNLTAGAIALATPGSAHAPVPSGPPASTEDALPEPPLEHTAPAQAAPVVVPAAEQATSTQMTPGTQAGATTPHPAAAAAPAVQPVSDKPGPAADAVTAAPAPKDDDEVAVSDDDTDITASTQTTGHHTDHHAALATTVAAPTVPPAVLAAVQPQPAPTIAEPTPAAEEQPAKTSVASATSSRTTDAQTAAPADLAPAQQTVAPHQPAPTAPVTAPAAPAPVTAPARTVPADVAAHVRQQLTGPIVKVAESAGEQILVVQVRPENLGPVTVHAHVRDNAVHVELFAPSDAGRDALTQVAADLRADLQQAHTGNTSLNVSSQMAPSADRDGKPRDGSSAEPRTGDRHPSGDTTGQDAQQHQPRGSNRLLDVLA